MKKSIIVLTGALGLSAIIAIAQDGSGPRRGGPGGPGGPGGQRPRPPLVTALDTNNDGKLDAKEIINAATALKMLDKNNDGEITPEEMFAPRPDGPRRGPCSPGRPGGDPGERPQPPEQ